MGQYKSCSSLNFSRLQYITAIRSLVIMMSLNLSLEGQIIIVFMRFHILFTSKAIILLPSWSPSLACPSLSCWVSLSLTWLRTLLALALRLRLLLPLLVLPLCKAKYYKYTHSSATIISSFVHKINVAVGNPSAIEGQTADILTSQTGHWARCSASVLEFEKYLMSLLAKTKCRVIPATKFKFFPSTWQFLLHINTMSRSIHRCKPCMISWYFYCRQMWVNVIWILMQNKVKKVSGILCTKGVCSQASIDTSNLQFTSPSLLVLGQQLIDDWQSVKNGLSFPDTPSWLTHMSWSTTIEPVSTECQLRC